MPLASRRTLVDSRGSRRRSGEEKTKHDGDKKTTHSGEGGEAEKGKTTHGGEESQAAKRPTMSIVQTLKKEIMRKRENKFKISLWSS